MFRTSRTVISSLAAPRVALCVCLTYDTCPRAHVPRECEPIGVMYLSAAAIGLSLSFALSRRLLAEITKIVRPLRYDHSEKPEARGENRKCREKLDRQF